MKLKKELNLLYVFCIATGAMLPGVFILPGLAFEIAGPAVLISYGLAGLLALTGLLSQAELVSAMPRAGGTYFYVTRSMGGAVGTVYGLITWLALSLKSAYELMFMATLGAILAGSIHLSAGMHLIAVVLCILFLAINLIGTKEAGMVQIFIVLILIAVLLFFCLRSYPSMNVRNFEPFLPNGAGSVFLAAGFVFISFGGLLKVASVAEEVKSPGKTIPNGMLLAFLAIMVVYAAVVFISIAVCGGNLAASKTPVSDAASKTMSAWGENILIIAAILAIISSVNAGIMSASRYPLALGRDEMLPGFLAEIGGRFKTPHNSILLTGAIIILALFVDINILVKAASSVLILTYIFTSLAVIILRESHIQNYRPVFNSPLYPWIQVLGLLGFICLLFELGTEALLVTCIMMGLGFPIYWFYGRKRASREYALLHLVERLTDTELTSYDLENELKEIIDERDEILKDRFDHLLEKCPVLDLKGPLKLEEFSDHVSQAMAEYLNLDKDGIHKKLLNREKQTSTVLNPFLAIPHIVIGGDKQFGILLARCIEGIRFSQTAPQVHAAFFLIGTKDERTFHLQALAAICQIVQEDDFEKRWMGAKNADALRDIILLGKRKRPTA
jgi:APA family basic amino acid/polyamine antiporter